MDKIQELRTRIYDQFQNSTAGWNHFFLEENRDVYAAYYTSMYLVQDTAEALYAHMAQGFSSNPMTAYIEFWGVMQATFIQQDAISELHLAIVGSKLVVGKSTPWQQLREARNLCAGHPANKANGAQRTFMGRSFGNYKAIKYEMYDVKMRTTSHPSFNLSAIIEAYDTQAGAILENVLIAMKTRWP